MGTAAHWVPGRVYSHSATLAEVGLLAVAGSGAVRVPFRSQAFLSAGRTVGWGCRQHWQRATAVAAGNDGSVSAAVNCTHHKGACDRQGMHALLSLPWTHGPCAAALTEYCCAFLRGSVMC